jgi:hypothetical protein
MPTEHAIVLQGIQLLLAEAQEAKHFDQCSLALCLSDLDRAPGVAARPMHNPLDLLHLLSGEEAPIDGLHCAVAATFVASTTKRSSVVRHFSLSFQESKPSTQR